MQGTQRKYFGHGRRTVKLGDVGLEVQVTNQYKHLGGLVDGRARGAAEARRRIGLATSAFEEGKSSLYLNATIPLDTRSLRPCITLPFGFRRALTGAAYVWDTPDWSGAYLAKPATGRRSYTCQQLLRMWQPAAPPGDRSQKGTTVSFLFHGENSACGTMGGSARGRNLHGHDRGRSSVAQVRT